MAKAQKSSGGAVVAKAAEVIGQALGSIAGTIESLQAQHPHPVEEAREALAAGQEKLTAMASGARTRAAAAFKTAKAGARRSKKVAAQARRKSTKAVARGKSTARKVVKRATKAVKRGQKLVTRAGRRLKR